MILHDEPFRIGRPRLLSAPAAWVADVLMLQPTRLEDTYTRPVEPVELHEVQGLAHPEPIFTLEDLHDHVSTEFHTRRLRENTALEDEQRAIEDAEKEKNRSRDAWKKHWKTRRSRFWESEADAEERRPRERIDRIKGGAHRVTYGETARRERERLAEAQAAAAEFWAAVRAAIYGARFEAGQREELARAMESEGRGRARMTAILEAQRRADLEAESESDDDV